MIVLGVDPGTRYTGYGLVEERGNTLRAISCGVIAAADEAQIGDRLKKIHAELTQLIETHRPDAVALERAFYSKSISSAFRIGEARAIAILCAAQAGVPLAEYAPKEVKSAVVGAGGAQKLQVQSMVRILLNLRDAPEPLDASDALAIAICHCQRAAGREFKESVRRHVRRGRGRTPPLGGFHP